jgi:hypothetical protein
MHDVTPSVSRLIGNGLMARSVLAQRCDAFLNDTEIKPYAIR